MIDQNPFANMSGGNQNYQTPDYLKPTQAGGLGNNISNMMKALVAGNQQYQQRMRGQGGMQGQPQMAPGAPMNLAPPMDPTSPMNPTQMTGAQPVMAPPQTGAVDPSSMPGAVPLPQPRPVFDASAAPMGGMDPMTAALFSQIPGVSGG